jgi:hypothetical protein
VPGKAVRPGRQPLAFRGPREASGARGSALRAGEHSGARSEASFPSRICGEGALPRHYSPAQSSLPTSFGPKQGTLGIGLFCVVVGCGNGREKEKQRRGKWR